MKDIITRLRTPEMLLMLMAAAVPLSFSTWSALINNFAIEKAAFDGAEFGLLQSVREVPGFMAFLVVFLLIWFREQYIAVVSLLMLGVGAALTGFFPSIIGLLLTTTLMSVGFHYYETIQNSLSLQWIDKERTPYVLGKLRTPYVLGKLIAVGSFTSLVAYLLIYLGLKILGLSYALIYVIGGGLTVAIAIAACTCYPHYPGKVVQHKRLILRKRYWLYYILTFLSGARRQIFVVFAGFMMVEKFGYSAAALTMLFLVNCVINIWLAPRIGKLVAAWGERNALTFEYIGLIIIFTSYAFVQNANLAAVLYILDHLFFALAIAIKTYFQKIADHADIASTAGVSFTISHIAAVILPVVLGVLWLTSPSAVFLTGSCFAALSLVFCLLVPNNPHSGNEVRLPFEAETAH
jgi:hypothetical protein